MLKEKFLWRKTAAVSSNYDDPLYRRELVLQDLPQLEKRTKICKQCSLSEESCDELRKLYREILPQLQVSALLTIGCLSSTCELPEKSLKEYADVILPQREEIGATFIHEPYNLHCLDSSWWNGSTSYTEKTPHWLHENWYHLIILGHLLPYLSHPEYYPSEIARLLLPQGWLLVLLGSWTIEEYIKLFENYFYFSRAISLRAKCGKGGVLLRMRD